MIKLYHSTMQEVLDKMYSLSKIKPLALMLHGTFGIGKTAGMEKFARRKAQELKLKFSKSFNDINKEDHFCFLTLILHQYEPAEIKGLPFPNEKRDQTIYLPVGILPTAGQGLLFIDEINLASPMLQNNAYQLIEDRRIGFYEIPKGYMVCGAGNKDDDRGHTFEMAMPLNNRFLHAELMVPPVEDIEHEGKSIKGWVNDYAMEAGIDHRIINYLMYQKKHLFTYNPQIDESEVTIATPRMWDKVSSMIKGIPDTDEWALHTFMGMGVGTGIASEFVAWLKLSRKYNIAALFKGEKFERPKEVDVLYSLISAIVSHYAEHLTSKNVNDLAVRVLELAKVFSKEHTVMMLNQAKSLDPDFFKKIKSTAPDKYAKIADELFNLLI